MKYRVKQRSLRPPMSGKPTVQMQKSKQLTEAEGEEREKIKTYEFGCPSSEISRSEVKTPSKKTIQAESERN